MGSRVGHLYIGRPGSNNLVIWSVVKSFQKRTNLKQDTVGHTALLQRTMPHFTAGAGAHDAICLPLENLGEQRTVIAFVLVSKVSRWRKTKALQLPVYPIWSLAR